MSTAPLRGLVVLTVALALLVAAPSARGSAACDDALHARVRTELSRFTGWLSEHDVDGVIGEVGWPGDAEGSGEAWNRLAAAWFDDAAAADLPVVAWATGEWWGTTYPLAVYEDTDGGGVDTARPQAQVLESSSVPRRGVSVAGAEFGAPQVEETSDFSNANPGQVDVDYHYDGAATFDFVAARGLDLVRIPFRWERLQPTPGGPLDAAELGRLRDAVARAGGAGLSVVLDLHNFGGYYLEDGGSGTRALLGSEALPASRLADLWGRLARAFREEPAVVAYGLMNEPVGLPGGASTWERASQAAVDTIRAAGDGTAVHVGGHGWSGVQRWPEVHPSPWIDDPADRVRYEAHHYWDRDNSGTYVRGYDAEVDDAAARGFACPPGSEPSCSARVERVAGPDRVATAVAAARAGWDDADVVLLARADEPADALAGAALAGHHDAPLLLTPPDRLPDTVRDEIRRLGADRVVVLGGPAAVEDHTAARLRRDGLAVDRVAGPDRFATAARIAERLAPADTALVVRGGADGASPGWADALAVSGLAARRARDGRASPVLLVSSEVPDPTRRALDDLGVRAATIVGGEAAVDDGVAARLRAAGLAIDRVAGADRYATSRRVAQLAPADACAPTILATGATFPDGLAGGALAGRLGATVLLSRPDRLAAPTASWFNRHRDRVGPVLLLGGERALTPRLVDGVREALSR